VAFVLSNRGKQKLSENGYVHVKNKKSADRDKVFWNCEKCTSDKCKAVVHLDIIWEAWLTTLK